MAKRTAIIDIGSNSARLVIFEKTSRYGFHLICEQKSKVRLGEGAYHKEGYLQAPAIKRAFLTLKSFQETINKYQARKTLCIATSALRDAPNRALFITYIQKELGLNIRVIDGKQEATYGAIAAYNLLPITEGITIDIGGGSSDLTLIQKGKVLESHSLDLGTVRIKELFSSDKSISKEAQSYIQEALKRLPSHFKHAIAIGIGGTARTLSKGIMKRSDYPLDKLHAFTYSVDEHREYLEAIPRGSVKNLKAFSLKKNRYDTIREGTLIFNALMSHLGTQEVVTSSVGVREGVFLETLLHDDKHTFPKTLNPSIVSILDRFKPQITIDKKRKMKLLIGKKLYTALQTSINDNMKYEKELNYALKLSAIGKTLTIYKAHQHAFYIAMQELNYDFTHKEMVLISLLLRMHGKELLHKPLFQQYKTLLPEKQSLLWLSFIYTLTVFLHSASNAAKIDFSFKHNTLTIHSDKPLYLTKEKIKSLEKPMDFTIVVEDADTLPSCEGLGI
ncbi:MAG: Ppx/GppA family phosphatase [Sulfurovum sp.]|nr:Ppx/GppA family phosphatase [Sulfurovum sp.]